MEDVGVSLVDVDTPDALDPHHVVRMLYFYSELAVVAVRGEARSTNTRLPIDDPEELYQLMKLSELLFPGIGFSRARVVCARAHSYFDPNESDEISSWWPRFSAYCRASTGSSMRCVLPT